jgi:nucleotidyltransferase/DNA polymerase involved in DNA repair
MQDNVNNLFLHADGDSFFVACELTLRPELRGKPVIVGEDRGIAVAMSIEAKRLGVTRGMPIFRIKKLFPQVVILPHHFDLYHDISERMHQILESYCQTIEVYSIDECFAIVKPHDVKFFGGEKKLLTELKNEIEKTLKVTYSLGLARTKALAKQASKLEKPNGLVILLSKEEEARALKATMIDDIWGIGRQTVPRLMKLGMKTAYDFVNYPEKEILKNFSEPVLNLKKELMGESVFEVDGNVDPRDQKSIQATSTFRPASTLPTIIWSEIAKNAEHACENTREIHLVSNKISFFVKTSEFKYHFDEVKLNLYTADPGIILNALEPKFPKLIKNKGRIRSTGVILHNLIREENAPRDLFGKQDKELGNLLVEETADKIRKKFGAGAIKRVASLKRK